MPRDRTSPPPPLDRPALERMALRYVERFATTRTKLVRYLVRKVRERGWDDPQPADAGALADRFVELGYIDDRGFAEAKATSLSRRGYGARRIDADLRHAGIDEEDRAAIEPVVADGADAAALAFARRRRIGPYATAMPDREQRQRQLAAMLRAGHDFATARAIVAMVPGQDIPDP